MFTVVCKLNIALGYQCEHLTPVIPHVPQPEAAGTYV